MVKSVTSRFVECVHVLKERAIISSYRQFALSLDMRPQSLNSILNGSGKVSVDVVSMAAELYNLNLNYLFAGDGDFFNQEVEEIEQEAIANITYVPVAAQAGYGGQIYDQILEESVPKFSLPGYEYKRGEHRCFDISGDSMEPCLYSGDKAVCSMVDKAQWKSRIRSGFVYIIVTQDSVYAKRVENNISLRGKLKLTSDNSFYEPFTLSIDEVAEVWEVELRIAHFDASPKSVKVGLFDQVESLKAQLVEQTQTIKGLNSTIELLLRNSRKS